MMVVRMKDIAERAGVSESAVSLVLSGRRRESVSSETRKRILAIVDELGYRPNQHARSLATGSTNTFGVIVSEISNPFFPEIIHSFEARATAGGFETQLINTEYDPQREKFGVGKMIDNRVCGIAVFTSQLDRKLIDEIVRNHIPIVSVGAASPQPWIGRITIDFSKGLESLLRHLVSLGHRRFAAIIGPKEIPSVSGYVDTLNAIARKEGVRINQVISCNYRHDGGMQSIHTLVRDPNFPTAILCGNDLIALGAISALEQAGMSVPQDVSIVGFDDIVFARLARPPLTTAAVPREELGALAFEMISKMASLKRPRGELRLLTPTLVVRGSTAPPRAGSSRSARATK
jgi:LacI family transcriptional regulator